MNVTRNAEIIPKSPNEGFPVIVFSHGLGAFKHLFSVYCKEWASHGYIVLSVDYDEQIYYKWKEYSDFVAVRLPQLEVRRTTIRKVLDYIHNEKYIQELFIHKVKLDYNKVFLAGHSFGSATSATLVTAYEREIAGIILLDPWLDPCNEELFTKPLQKPMLLLRSEQFAKMRPIYEKVERFIQANKEHIFSGYLKGTVHNDVTDFILTLPKNIKHALRLAKETDRKYREDKLMLHSGIVQIFTDTVCQEINRNDPGKDFPGDMREKVLEFLRKNRKEEEFHFDM